MDDREQIIKLYEDMYAAMVAKDEAELERVHADSFVLIHMTGMHQSKKEYVRAIMDGTLNYYSEETGSLDIDIKGDAAEISGRSVVSAAVFGGSRHTWRLALKLGLRKTGGEWKFTRAQASTW